MLADELTKKHNLLTIGIVEAEVVFDTLGDCICELEDDATTCNADLYAVARAVWSLKSHVAVGKPRVNILEVQACQTLGQTLKLRSLAESLALTVDGEHVQVTYLVDVKL